MKNSIIVFFGLLSVAVQAQSFSWGFPFSKSDETEKNITHVVADQLYRISTHYDLGVFNHKVTVDQFSLNDLERTNSLDLSVQQPPMGVASLTFNSLFQKEGTQFVFFYTDFDRSDKKYKLFSRDVDIKTGSMGELRPIASMDSKNGNFVVSQSANHSHFAVLKELPFAKKTNEKIEMLLLDKEQKNIGEKVLELPFEDKRDQQHSIFVSNEGQVVLVKKIDEKKEKPYLNLYVWNKDKTDVATISLQQPDNYQIPQFKGKFKDGNFYLLGILTHEKSGTFGLQIDMNGRHSGVPANGLLAVKINADGSTAYMKRNDFDVVTNLNLKDFLFGPENIFVVGDRMFVEKKSKGSNIGQQGFSYDYGYLNNGFLVQGLNEATGQMEFSTQIDTAEPNTQNDNGDFLSTLYYLDGSNLVLLYNETRDINKGMVHLTFHRRFPIKEVISPTGESLGREALLGAGIGVTKEEEFELNTQLLIPVNPRKFLLRASNRIEYKYGYMEL
ncbi:MAG: hypothetical protein Q8O88_01780 [bacterium]|nr:hypothetical protein [bacterium]